MKFVASTECREGDLLAEDIVNTYGATIVAQNTVLNSYIISKLNDQGIQQVKIYDERKEIKCRDENQIYRQTKESYKESILDIKSIINQLAAGRPLNAEKVLSITNEVCCGMHESCQVLNVIKEEKKLDEYTYTHSLNVAIYSMLIGKWLRLDNESIRNVIKAGILHDIGKTNIPVEILNKKAKLSDEEFKVIKNHTRYGYELIKDTDCLSDEVCKAVLLHHEREDKSGYPFGIEGSKIGLYAKIVAVADVYDAMTSDRVYKSRTTPFEVFGMFKTIGVKNFDPKIVKTFLNNLSTFYVGSKVLLNTGDVGEVVYIPPHSLTDPVISVNNNYIDLSIEEDKHILLMM